MAGRYPTSLFSTALETEQNYACNIRESVNFISNDSATYPVLVNFDNTVDAGGTIKILPGEAISDLRGISFTRIYVRGVGGSVPFRIVGV